MITKLKSALASLYVRAVCKFTPCCQEMTRLISEAHEHSHGPLLRLRMKLHFGICVWCLRYRDQLEMIRTLIRRFPGPSDEGEAMLSNAAKDRIRDALREAGEGDVNET